ncbi:MAG: hypothetical protein HC853_05700 [Anaerolineae bacterium]|nr:hypothetical protein [Anaerolineae bacterium]
MTQSQTPITLETPTPGNRARVSCVRVVRAVHPLVWVSAATVLLYASLAWLYPLGSGCPGSCAPGLGWFAPTFRWA